MNRDFKTVFIKKLSQKKWNDFERTIRMFMKDSVSDYQKDRNVIEWGDGTNNTIRPSVNNADYCQAFGMVQGVCYYCLGYNFLGCDNEEGSPKKWIRDLEAEYGKIAYELYLLLPKKVKVG